MPSRIDPPQLRLGGRQIGHGLAGGGQQQHGIVATDVRSYAPCRCAMPPEIGIPVDKVVMD
ncbi:hypothetical protein [Fodinicola acaciae]|uniref:hypothetical protein n=1 Tax=Fodinicola acaciae TaxID=2681555 RepID=UPI0013D15980|nr:hypothetical protein [Fodinicola acaciae]